MSYQTLAVLCLHVTIIVMVDAGKFGGTFRFDAGKNPEDYLILTRTRCQSQTAKDTKEFTVPEVKKCLVKCNDDRECKALSYDASSQKCTLKIACDAPVHDLNFVSYVSTKTLKGKALPRHYVVSGLNDKVLTVGSESDGVYSLSFEDKKSSVDQSQQFYAEKFPGTPYFYIRWDGNIKLVVGIDHESTDTGARLVLSMSEALKPKFSQLWTWREKASLMSKSKYDLVMQVNDDVNPVTAEYKEDKDNQEFSFEI